VTDTNSVDPGGVGSEESGPTSPAVPKVTDKRRLDPVTGALRDAGEGSGAAPVDDAAQTDDAETVAAAAAEVAELAEVDEGDEIHPDTTLAADLTRDLQMPLSLVMASEVTELPDIDCSVENSQLYLNAPSGGH